MRFVLVSFLFLGWAFYELSGGADFEPPKRPEGQSASAGSQIRMVAEQQVVVPDPVNVIALPKQPDLVAVARRTDPPAPAATAAAPEPAAPRLELAFVQDNAETGDNVQLASLADGNEAFPEPLILDSGLTAVSPASTEPEPAAAEEEPVTDVYRITGSRVNMRQGPGTTYAVLGTLFFDDQVEVLQDPGIGWVQLRKIGDGQIGWMAARFVGRAVEQ